MVTSVSVLLPALRVADQNLTFTNGVYYGWRLIYRSSLEFSVWSLAAGGQEFVKVVERADSPQDGRTGTLLTLGENFNLYAPDQGLDEYPIGKQVRFSAPLLLAFGPAEAPEELVESRVKVEKLSIVSMKHRRVEEVWRPIRGTQQYRPLTSIPSGFGREGLADSGPGEVRSGIGIVALVEVLEGTELT